MIDQIRKLKNEKDADSLETLRTFREVVVTLRPDDGSLFIYNKTRYRIPYKKEG